ncbi:MAG: S41 family peptidase [Clostridia bacterium]|nr:S41 family peptidase [Clostridia bacterium]
MKKNISFITLIICIIVASVIVFASTFTILSGVHRAELAKAYGENTIDGDQNAELPSSGDKRFYEEKLEVIEDIFRYYSYYDLDTEAILDTMIDGFAYGTGDRYAEYYNAEEFALLTAENEGEMQGIGINVVFNSDYKAIEVINVMPDSPALDAGVLPGDLIVKVGIGENAQNVSELGYNPALASLQGTAGTICDFTVARGEYYEDIIDFSIERKFVTVQTVTHHISSENPEIGILRILSFDGVTPTQFFEALDDLTAKGAKKFVFDVRNNPGGDLNSICEILDFILPEGPIIRTRDKNGVGNTISSGPEEFNSPMVVLCNENTASAAELFTSALMDYKKAISVGGVTYGKGSMQTLLPLSDGSGIKLTTKMYFPPFSEGYDGIGITPDIEIQMPEELKNVNLFKISDNEDTQLQRAIKYLNENY